MTLRLGLADGDTAVYIWSPDERLDEHDEVEALAPGDR
jgi:hypothetical protein